MKSLLAVFLLLGLVSCSGGSSSGTLITGTLEQAGEAHDHSFRHESGEKIENVEICALGQCSTTDGEGQWGFQVETGNIHEAVFTIKGHGINASTTVGIVPGADEIEIEFQHADGHVTAHEVTANGQEIAEDL